MMGVHTDPQVIGPKTIGIPRMPTNPIYRHPRFSGAPTQTHSNDTHKHHHDRSSLPPAMPLFDGVNHLRRQPQVNQYPGHPLSLCTVPDAGLSAYELAVDWLLSSAIAKTITRPTAAS